MFDGKTPQNVPAYHTTTGAAFLVPKSAGWCCGTLIKDFRCITPHAQRTAVTYFTGAVKSDVVHFIVACWAFLLQKKSLSELNRLFTLGGQQKYLLMPA